MKKFCVIGTKTEMSKSPLFHTIWIKAYGLDAGYMACNVPVEGLEPFICSLHSNNFSGINITVPHKEQAYAILDKKFPGSIDNTARKIGAINTIKIDGNGEYTATNTDAYGFIQNILTSSQLPAEWGFAGKQVVIIGAGGATRAVIAGLEEAGVKHISLLNRTEQKALEIARAFKPILAIDAYPWEERSACLRNADMLINCTSLGMKGSESLDISLALLPQKALVTDIVYNPLLTPLLEAAKAQGNPVIDGLGMLLYQGQKSFSLWHGITPEVTGDLRQELLRAIGEI
jgi:shikimate dehydrogenase